MEKALHVRTKVLAGHRIEIVAPNLKEGEPVDVILLSNEGVRPSSRTMRDLLNTLPVGPRSGASWEEIERNFQTERNAATG